MPGFFDSVTGKNCATLFEIRLDQDLVILRGARTEAASQRLTGRVVLCLAAPLKVDDVHLRLTGTLRVGWVDQRTTNNSTTTSRVEKDFELLCHRWPPFISAKHVNEGVYSKSVVLPAGNYEWPFEYIIPGSIAESVEGLNDSFLSYKLKATVARGLLAYDLRAYKPVRIIRTLDPAALELSHAMTVENTWPDKIDYFLVIPQKAVIFGSQIEIGMRFTSLLKGLRIGTIKCAIVECQDLCIPGRDVVCQTRNYRHIREVGSWAFDMNEEEHYREVLDETGQDGYVMTQYLPLPKSLSKCLQDVEINGIKIRHKVRFIVALHNPDGHTSELRATLPVHIFISPNMPIDETGNLLDQTPTASRSANFDSHAPPLYGEHVLDQLYADIDMSGLMTPVPQSALETPLRSRSRTGSSDNLQALGGNGRSMDSIASGTFQPDALSSRLQNLSSTSRGSSFLRRSSANGTGAMTPRHISEGDHSISLHHRLQSAFGRRSSLGTSQPSLPENDRRNSAIGSAPNGDTLSRHTSGEEVETNLADGFDIHSDMQTPEHIDYPIDLGTLSRVPSYQTAVKTPARVSDIGPLPNYNEAISRPASPSGRRSTSAASTQPRPVSRQHSSEEALRAQVNGEGR